MGEPSAHVWSEQLGADGWSLARRGLARPVSGSGRVRQNNQSLTKRYRLPVSLAYARANSVPSRSNAALGLVPDLTARFS